MKIVNRRRVMGKSLPYDAEIEYLESTGTQFIDTGLKLCSGIYNNFRIETKIKSCAKVDATRLAVILACVREQSPFPGFIIRYDGDVCVMYNNNSIIHVGGLDSIIEINRFFDNISQHDIPTTLYAGYNGAGGVFRYSKVTIYHLKIYGNEELIADFIPVRIGQVGYMYDKVSKQLFGNAGTGEFILGPDVTSGGNS